MRKIRWEIIFVILIILLSGPNVFAESFSGWVNLVRNTSESFEDDEKISDTEMFNRNIYLKLNKSITPMLKYQVNLRTNLSDTDSADSNGIITRSAIRRFEPAVDFSLNNRMYNVNIGLRRQEDWSSAELKDEYRETSEFYYTRFTLSPKALPSLSLNIERQKDFDYPPERETDLVRDSYSINSAYELPSMDMRFGYNFNFSHDVDKTPLSTTEKTINDNFNGSYNFGYNGNFWNRKARYTLGYQGNYARNKNQQFLSQTGSFSNIRITLDTLESIDNSPLLDPLNSNAASQLLHNGDYTNDVTGIKLNTAYRNIGILIISNEVDSLRVYYKNNGAAAQVTWRVYWSNNNLDWNFISETAVSPVLDVEKNAYRYTIDFTPTTAIYFKAVNVNTVPQVDFSDVEITEIEAFGTDDILELQTVSVSTSFNQGLSIAANVRPESKLNFAFNYSLDRADQNPVSFGSSVLGVLNNILTDTVSGDEHDFRSNITRNYGLTTTWQPYTLVTTALRFQRTENFDNLDETDTESNTYHASFNYVPLPTLDTTLSLIRSDRYSFSEKNSTNNSLLLSIGSRLYRDINMITDMGYNKSRSFATDTDTSSYSINGTIDALITRKMSGTMNYGYNSTVSDGKGSVSKDVMTTINYQPGRFINLSGNFSISKSEGNVTTSEGIFMDWLPLPAIRLNMSYNHTDSEPGPVISDTISGYAIWYIAKFADLRFSYGYTKQVENVKTENYNFNTNLNCRF